jgi:hypothetical protein
MGFLFGGRASRVLAPATPVPVRPLVAAGGILLLSGFTPGPFSWLLPLALAVVAGIWAVWRGIYPIACGSLGAYCNEVVRAANGGRMPVEGYDVMGAVSKSANTYVPAGPGTNFAWLDDRFMLPPPFPGIASAGDILIAIGMAWFVAMLMLRRPAEVGAEDAAGDDDAPDLDDLRGDAAAAA